MTRRGTRPLRIGTRGSALARWQADHIAQELDRLGAAVQILEITTRGDDPTQPIATAGAEGAFTKRIQQALLDDEVDLAVHSLKDLPTAPHPGLVLAAVPPREPPEDALVTGLGSSLEELPEGACIGTGSIRRKTQLIHARADLKICPIRGNVDTRLAKLDAGEVDALVLAAAGLLRLGLADRIAGRLGPPLMLPAVGQGALGIECRDRDAPVRALLAKLDHAPTRAAVVAERAMLATLRGGCLAPVGGWGRTGQDALWLSGVVLSEDGQTRLFAEQSGPADDAAGLGSRVAEDLLAQGAGDLIAAVR